MSKITFKDIISYIQGNIRYQAYYSTRFTWLIRKHIREQIEFRINSMDRNCYTQGSCIMCGCKTTALQMANKMCDNPCYPEMVTKKIWKIWKNNPSLWFGTKDFKIKFELDLDKKKFVRV